MSTLQKTIHAPYCQGNVVVLGENAGQQFVAMRLCALIYSTIRRIASVNDMIQIMIVHLRPEMHAMAEMARMAKNRQPLAIRTGCQKWPL